MQSATEPRLGPRRGFRVPRAEDPVGEGAAHIPGPTAVFPRPVKCSAVHSRSPSGLPLEYGPRWIEVRFGFCPGAPPSRYQRRTPG